MATNVARRLSNGLGSSNPTSRLLNTKVSRDIEGTNKSEFETFEHCHTASLLKHPAQKRRCQNYLLKQFAVPWLKSDGKLKEEAMDMPLLSGHCEIDDRRDHAGDVVGSRESAEPAPARRTALATVAGSGWYHDAAIEQASRAAIEARCNPYG